MPWSPVLDQNKWIDAIEATVETLKKKEDAFTSQDWDLVAEKYAQEGGRFKPVVKPDPKERDPSREKDAVKKVSGLMTSSTQDDLEAVAKRLEETRGKAAADFYRISRKMAGATPARETPEQRPPTASTHLPVTEDAGEDDMRQTFKRFLGRGSSRPSATPRPVEDKRGAPVRKQPVKKQRPQPQEVFEEEEEEDVSTSVVSQSILEVAEGEDVEEVARRLLESVLGR
jgi:hypothetical protein